MSRWGCAERQLNGRCQNVPQSTGKREVGTQAHKEAHEGVEPAVAPPPPLPPAPQDMTHQACMLCGRDEIGSGVGGGGRAGVFAYRRRREEVPHKM